jgi:hypothetical protein
LRPVVNTIIPNNIRIVLSCNAFICQFYGILPKSAASKL